MKMYYNQFVDGSYLISSKAYEDAAVHEIEKYDPELCYELVDGMLTSYPKMQFDIEINAESNNEFREALINAVNMV